MRNTIIGLVAGAVLVAVVVLLVNSSDPEPEPLVEEVETGLASVITTDLIDSETLSGNLRFREPRTVRSGLAGTITDLPEAGDIVTRGSVLFELDGLPVLVLEGERPAWRPFIDGMDDGADVLQLETELERLGFLEVEPDEEFDGDTANAVEDWREDVGLPEGETIELGRILFVAEPVRVGSVLVEEGQAVSIGVPLFEVTSRSQEVLLEFDPDELDLVSEGQAVIVILPDDRRIPGEVREIGRSARSVSPEPGAPIVVEVLVGLRGTGVDLDRAPVDVEIEKDRAAGVLAVPVRALLSLSDGGYAVEIARSGGDTDLVAVEVGEFAEGLVEVSGPIAEGDQVVIPR